LAGETELLGENLPQCRFVHHKPHMLPVRESGPPRWDDDKSLAYLIFLDGLKKLEQRSHKYVELRGEYVE
jgi:hypothetical protein